jgi:hypothetical protein
MCEGTEAFVVRVITRGIRKRFAHVDVATIASAAILLHHVLIKHINIILQIIVVLRRVCFEALAVSPFPAGAIRTAIRPAVQLLRRSRGRGFCSWIKIKVKIILLVALPQKILFFAVQRYFVTGLCRFSEKKKKMM